MDDQNLHDDDELESIDDDSLDTEVDDDETPADTDDESDEPKKETAEDVKERQKKAWVAHIREGKKSLEDMPENLGWLKREVQAELGTKPEKKVIKEDEVDIRVRKALQAERDADEFNSLVDFIENSDTDEELLASMRENYDELKKEGLGKLKALKLAMRLSGIKDAQTAKHERRRKGMVLPPLGGARTRKVVGKDGMNEVERKLSSNLPPGFKI